MKLPIILLGLKHSGKTTLGKEIAKNLSIPWFDLDELLQEWYKVQHTLDPETFPLTSQPGFFFPRLILSHHGNQFFQHCEFMALKNFLHNHLEDEWVLSTGGGIMTNEKAMSLLSFRRQTIVYLQVKESLLFERIVKKGLPSYLHAHTLDESRKLWHTVYEERDALAKKIASTSIDCGEDPIPQVLDKILHSIRT